MFTLQIYELYLYNNTSKLYNYAILTYKQRNVFYKDAVLQNILKFILKNEYKYHFCDNLLIVNKLQK